MSEEEVPAAVSGASVELCQGFFNAFVKVLRGRGFTYSQQMTILVGGITNFLARGLKGNKMPRHEAVAFGEIVGYHIKEAINAAYDEEETDES
jgi:hypothetical protein